jgi:hypothetical protein
MDLNQLSTLLWQNESETLDFKRDQNPFDSGTDEDRSELLKDILAFANAWRTSDAHILIGVQEVKGSRALVIGAQHLLNRTLQTVQRGTMQHEIFEGDDAVAFIDGATIRLKVNCRADAGRLDERVPYGLAVTLEAAQALRIPIYQEVAERINLQQEVRAV